MKPVRIAVLMKEPAFGRAVARGLAESGNGFLIEVAERELPEGLPEILPEILPEECEVLVTDCGPEECLGGGTGKKRHQQWRKSAASAGNLAKRPAKRRGPAGQRRSADGSHRISWRLRRLRRDRNGGDGRKDAGWRIR